MYKAMIIDDDEDYRNLLVRKLSREFPDISITEIDPLAGSLPDEEYEWDNLDFILLDYHLGIDETGLDWFKKFNSEEMPATILLTAKGSEKIAVNAIKIGVDEYMVKENFGNESLSASINDVVYNKKLVRAKHKQLSHKSIVFNKSNFIHRLGKIAREKEVMHHLLVFNPDSYQRIGEDKGLSLQDNYLNYVAKLIYEYLATKKIESNILIYREEYIATIVEIELYKKHLKNIYKMLDGSSFVIGSVQYPCSVSVGVISPATLDQSELNKNDFELLSISEMLCESAKVNKPMKVSFYGDINLNEYTNTGRFVKQNKETQQFDIVKVIADGRMSANYQPWIYLATDSTISLRDIYDVRVEMVDLKGDILTQQELVKIMDDPYSKRVVDRWVVRHSVTQIKELSAESGKKGNIKLAVKISLSTIVDPKFTPWLHELIKDANLPQNSLLFELEAAQFMRGLDEHIKFIVDFSKNYKIKFIITGVDKLETYNNVRDLHHFDFIKLNVKDLINDIPKSHLNKIVASTKEDGTKIVTVNVDSADMLNLATVCNSDYVQGYFVGKPQTDMVIDSDGDLYCVI